MERQRPQPTPFGPDDLVQIIGNHVVSLTQMQRYVDDLNAYIDELEAALDAKPAEGGDGG